MSHLARSMSVSAWRATWAVTLAVALAALVGGGVARAEDPNDTRPARREAASARRPSTPVVRYAIDFRGAQWTPAQRQRFEDVVHATLNDPRGWSLSGAVQFRRAGSGAFTITLATPSVVAAYGGCSSYWSCRSGGHVLINSARWFGATSTYPGQARLQLYRQLVVNHEVGHALGFGHAGCSASGRLAPVMMQQSKGLRGCVINPWPTAHEQGVYAARRGVKLGRPAPRLISGIGTGYISLGDDVRTVTARLGDPQGSRRAGRQRSDTYRAFGLFVRYDGDRVVRITTRNVLDRTGRGSIGVGSSYRSARALAGMHCSMRTGGSGTCSYGSAQRPTTFDFTGWKVARVILEVRS